MNTIIISQYRAGLKMLMDVITKCPDKLWENDKYENAYWRIVYHVLFYTAFYSSESIETFVAWDKHREGYNFLGSIGADNKPVIIENSYSKKELIEYAEILFENIGQAVEAIGEHQESGFYWIAMSKLELQIYNIRHIQHHIGQLVERLHENGIQGINWVGRG